MEREEERKGEGREGGRKRERECGKLVPREKGKEMEERGGMKIRKCEIQIREGGRMEKGREEGRREVWGRGIGKARDMKIKRETEKELKREREGE